MTNEEFLLCFLKAVAKYQILFEVISDKIYINNCSNSTMIEVTPDNIAILEQSFKDINKLLGAYYISIDLFAARITGKKPKDIDAICGHELYFEKIKALFDAISEE